MRQLRLSAPLRSVVYLVLALILGAQASLTATRIRHITARTIPSAHVQSAPPSVRGVFVRVVNKSAFDLQSLKLDGTCYGFLPAGATTRYHWIKDPVFRRNIGATAAVSGSQVRDSMFCPSGEELLASGMYTLELTVHSRAYGTSHFGVRITERLVPERLDVPSRSHTF